MESFSKFSKESLDNYLKNKKLKESLTNLDFDCLKNIMLKISGYENEQKCEGMSVDQANNGNVLQESEHSQQSKRYLDYLKEVSLKFRENLYNLKGCIHLIQTHLNKDKILQSKELNINFQNLRFDLEIILRDSNCEYHIRLFRIKADLMENLNKFAKKSIVYFTNLKAIILLNEKTPSNFYFKHTIQTKIYVKPQTIHDTETPLVFNSTIRGIYENEKCKPKCRRPNVKQSAKDKRSSFSDLLDITKSNENEYLDLIDSNNLNSIFTQIPQHCHDFTSLLRKTVSELTYGMKNILKANADITYKDVCGMIRSIRLEEKLLTFELVSIKDSNSIKVLIYNKHSCLDLKENMIIVIKSVAHKINKNFDFVLENPIESNIKVIGLLSNEDAAKLRKFRIDKNKKFSSLICLIDKTIDRVIQKYLVTIKKIFKIQAVYSKDHWVIPGCSNLKLIGKCLVDDGTFEGIMFFYDNMVVNLLKIDHVILEQISKSIQNCNNVVIYDKFDKHMILPKVSFENLYVNQLVVYGIPFSNIAKKNIYDNGYNKYFENLGQECNMKNKAKNLAFINGDVTLDKQMEEDVFVFKPYIRACNCDFLNSE